MTLLTQAQCGSCDHAKGILDRIADDFPLEIQTVDLSDADGRALAQSTGLLFPPGVVVEGQLFSHGRLSERKLRRHLCQISHVDPAQPGC